jgi:hypothetical protein
MMTLQTEADKHKYIRTSGLREKPVKQEEHTLLETCAVISFPVMHHDKPLQFQETGASLAKALAASVALKGSEQTTEPPSDELSVNETKPLLGFPRATLKFVQAEMTVILAVRPLVKFLENTMEADVGVPLGTDVGALVGTVVGTVVGVPVVGNVGFLLGICVGFLLGVLLGKRLGIILGRFVGVRVGAVGNLVGTSEGACVGLRVGTGFVGVVGVREVGDSVTVLVT